MEEQTNTAAETKKGNTTLVAIIGIVVIVVAGFAGYKFMHHSQTQVMSANEKQTAQPTTAAMQATEAPAASGGAMKSAYKDGTYSAVGSYKDPSGPEEVQVSLTLAQGVVKDAKVVGKATQPYSVKYQTMFVENYKPEVIGKNIDDLQLSKVSGSSLTPMGFNDAVEKIKAEAKS